MTITELTYKNYQDWLEKRKGFIGGSDAAAVMGLNPYCSPYSLWAEKTGKIEPFKGNLTTEVGSFLEEFVAELFTRETGKKLRRKNRILHNNEYPWAIANVDRMVVGEKALLEIKTTTSMPNMKLIRNEEYPAPWYCQVMHYLAVTGLPKGYLAVLVNNREFHLFEIDRDDAEIAALMEQEAAFYQMMINDTPPEVDGMDSTGSAIGQIYGDSMPGLEIDATPIGDHLRQYLMFGKQINQLKAMQDAEANAVKVYMGEAEKGENGEFRVSWKPQTRTSFDHKAYLKDNPYEEEKMAPYMKKSENRTFRVSEKN